MQFDFLLLAFVGSRLFVCLVVNPYKASSILVQRSPFKSSMSLSMNANGPAIWGGCVTRRKHRAGSWYFSREVIPVRGEYGMRFCSPGTKVAEHYACRGTKLKDGSVFIVVYRALKRALERSRYRLLQI